MLQEAIGSNANILIASIECTLLLKDVYDKLDFVPDEDDLPLG
ncbi:MAG: hypothetical protein GFH27_549303n242 [Chloroflexi bacterium AL-W]|nr:hypothetical protein [Chloroflexi bacterium AL-N1]NOK68127.1 hypothetical protein [Chloroflexi bacterium AL-N10]NOK73467.1 hypothetical protein [Chloroflexi bacterium AL-N5]NOK83381.1 hypothetical protein [Chloroflexi bacterium AL-W]NOK87798.1 hypothetical protein [Chloroflexi bacterium AL-N15]